MKKHVAFLLMGIIAVSLTACGGKEEPKEPAVENVEEEVKAEEPKAEEPKAEEPKAEETEEEKTETAPFVPVTAEWEGYTFTVVGAEHFVDIDGKDAIRIYYDCYNNSETTGTAWEVTSMSAEQDGYEAEFTYTDWGEEALEDGNDDLRIRPGACVRCIEEFTMKIDGGPLTFSIYDFWDETKRLDVDFEPQNLPGAPTEPLQMVTVEDPQWITDWPDQGVYKEEYYILIESAEKVVGENGEEILRVYYEFTNNSAEAENMWFVTAVNVYQDGVECPRGEAAEKVEEDDNYHLDVEPGETIRASDCYVLRSNSRIEVEIEGYWEEQGIGAMFE